MRRALALTVLLVATAAHAQSGTFRRWMRSLSSTRRVSAPLTSVDCTGAAQTLNDGSAITWTRATAATCTKTDGTLTGVTSGQPRCNGSGCRVEPAATNIVQRSETLDNAYWTKTNVTIAADNTTAPDGTSSADKVTMNAGAAAHFVGASWSATCASGTGVWTASSYVKAGTVSVVRLDRIGSWQYVIYDLSTLVVTVSPDASVGGIQPSRTAPTGHINALPNGWFRIDAQFKCELANQDTHVTYFGATTAALTTIAGAAPSIVAAGTETIYLWGTQGELGALSFPTSYIPTVATAVTRNADAASFAKPTWLTDARGCARATITFPNGQLASGTAARVLAMGATNTLLHIASTYDTVGATDGTLTASFSKTLIGTPALLSTFRSYWSPSGLVVTDGSSSNTVAYDGAILSGSTISLGSAQGTGNFLHGWISNIRIANKTTGCL